MDNPNEQQPAQSGGIGNEPTPVVLLVIAIIPLFAALAWLAF
jgi:hypothetical protein